MTLPLPVPGYPISDRAVRDFLAGALGREPTGAEVGEVLAALAHRDATPPVNEPVPVIGAPVLTEPAPTTRVAKKQ